MRNKYIIENDSINTIFKKYSSLINKGLNELLFFYRGKNLNIENKLDILSFQNINIFVFNKNKNNNSHNEKIKDVICPECKLLDTFIINDNSFEIENCKNNHNYSLTLDSFIDSQKIDESKINCYKCGNNKLFYNDLIYTNSKGKFICPLCLNQEEKGIVNNKFKYYICIIHDIKYESYCNNCKINLCSKCEENHKNHQIILFKKIKPSKNRIEEIKNEQLKLNKFKIELNELKNYIITICEYIKEEINNYNKIYDYIIDSIDNLSNYESLNNILNFKMDKLMKEVDDFLYQNNLNKIKNIINRYENKINELTIIYNRDKSSVIKLFGSEFVENNKGKCYLLINNKITELIERIIYKNYYNNNERIIKIRLIENKTYSLFSGYYNSITDMSYMFKGCSSLLSLPDISNWNTNNVTSMRCMFSRCSSLSSLPDISKWNTNNVIDMSVMFSKCLLLSSLPDISKWNINNVKDISYMFIGCSSLLSLPDISKWNTNNVTNMSEMFFLCKSLLSLPDISKWNINNVTNKKDMFHGLKNSLKIPNKFL